MFFFCLIGLVRLPSKDSSEPDSRTLTKKGLTEKKRTKRSKKERKKKRKKERKKEGKKEKKRK